jgi:hypothetical protein
MALLGDDALLRHSNSLLFALGLGDDANAGFSSLEEVRENASSFIVAAVEALLQAPVPGVTRHPSDAGDYEYNAKAAIDTLANVLPSRVSLPSYVTGFALASGDRAALSFLVLLLGDMERALRSHDLLASGGANADLAQADGVESEGRWLDDSRRPSGDAVEVDEDIPGDDGGEEEEGVNAHGSAAALSGAAAAAAVAAATVTAAADGELYEAGLTRDKEGLGRPASAPHSQVATLAAAAAAASVNSVRLPPRTPSQRSGGAAAGALSSGGPGGLSSPSHVLLAGGGTPTEAAAAGLGNVVHITDLSEHGAGSRSMIGDASDDGSSSSAGGSGGRSAAHQRHSSSSGRRGGGGGGGGSGAGRPASAAAAAARGATMRAASAAQQRAALPTRPASRGSGSPTRKPDSPPQSLPL